MLKHKNILTLTYKFTNTQTTPPFIFLTLNEQQNFLNLFLQKKKAKGFQGNKELHKVGKNKNEKKTCKKEPTVYLCL